MNLNLKNDNDEAEDEDEKEETEDAPNVNLELLNNRYVFLNGTITNQSASNICKQLFYLDLKNPKLPICLWINSGGGECDAAMSIINVMQSVRAPVVTIINNLAASAAGVISICGNQRVMYRSAYWMEHDQGGGIGPDYTSKIIDRAKFLKRYRITMDRLYKKHTKLTKADIKHGQDGELWLSSSECLKKGIVDRVIGL